MDKLLYHTSLNELTTIYQKQPPVDFYKKGVLINLAKFTGLRPATLLKRGSGPGVFL